MAAGGSLATLPNSGVPVPMLGNKPGKVHAAGVAFITPDQKMLFLRRGADGDHPGEWCFPGGVMEYGEDAVTAALREVQEETGFASRRRPEFLAKRDRDGVVFTTFTLPVDAPFHVRLNDEHSDSVWASADALPDPLHPGVAEVLQDIARTMRLMLASDRRVDLLALDRESVRRPDKYGRLHVAVTNISKATVNPYLGREVPGWSELGLDPDRVYQFLRDPKELEKAAPTFNNIQLLRQHTPVSADDHQPWEVVGSTGTDAKFSAPYLTNSLVVWSAEAIKDIESGVKKELSAGYGWRPDMTPGTFHGIRFDGIMREIVGNHIALVVDGRAGPDVVVGDSGEQVMAASKQIAAIATRAATISALVNYLRPRLAQDAKPKIAMAFDGVTGAGFKDKKASIVTAITEAVKPHLAKDASIEDLGKIVDLLEAHEIGGAGKDESVSQEQHGAMEAAAQGESNIGIPEKVGKEFSEADKGKSFDAEPLMAFLREKGMSEDDLGAIANMLPQTGISGDEDKDDDGDKPKDKDKDKDMVTQDAMNAAIKAASESTAKSVRETERGIRTALHNVRPWVGELSPDVAFDSAEAVYRHVAGALGVENHEKLHTDALFPIIKNMPKPGDAARRVSGKSPGIAQDAAVVSDFRTRFPGSERIRSATSGEVR